MSASSILERHTTEDNRRARLFDHERARFVVLQEERISMRMLRILSCHLTAEAGKVSAEEGNSLSSLRARMQEAIEMYYERVVPAWNEYMEVVSCAELEAASSAYEQHVKLSDDCKSIMDALVDSNHNLWAQAYSAGQTAGCRSAEQAYAKVGREIVRSAGIRRSRRIAASRCT